MYTKVTPKAGQNGPMWLYVGSTPTFLAFWLGITYNYFSMMVVGYMVKFQARFAPKVTIPGHPDAMPMDPEPDL